MVQHIIDVIKTSVEISVSLEQIKHQREDYIVDMIALMNGESKNDIAQLSAAEKLIQLFENMINVSFVYGKHEINSGFVSYTKQKTNQQTFKCSLIQTMSNPAQVR